MPTNMPSCMIDGNNFINRTQSTNQLPDDESMQMYVDLHA